jgi:hypothetical protein
MPNLKITLYFTHITLVKCGDCELQAVGDVCLKKISIETKLYEIFSHHTCNIHSSKHATIFMNTRKLRYDTSVWKKENI